MKEFEAIKEFYNPIQPTVKAENTDIFYHEIRPNKKIEDFVYCFWQLKTKQALAKPYVYSVVSDGCIDIFFNHNRPSENFVMGFCRKYAEFSIGKEFDYIGIRFLPSAFSLLFGIDAKLLSNRSQDLKNVLPDFSAWISKVVKASLPFEKVAGHLNMQLGKVLNKRELKFDQRFFSSLHLIFQKNGFLDTEKDLDTGLSPRQLRRIFNYYIGTTPKAFSNVVRFQHILSAKASNQSLKANKLYFDVGFFDQAHFIKNFKTFYGVTPSEAFR
ncbi:AraC family transcriptional regulator [Flagellimonas allohymeniacidonis]|uniref:AraC family transcriptional regulator n=1 Tax=Flagellimonas allohymeniacidonis TaxID=2517819 RepID=UPI00197C445D|nr:helix-turn-helix domain-containing protein [Allomuricauda hymeniacidonis]